MTSTLNARPLDLSVYLNRYEGLPEEEATAHATRIRALNPYSIGIELLFGTVAVTAWVENRPLDGIVPQDQLDAGIDPTALDEDTRERALDAAVARYLDITLFRRD